MKPFSQHLPLNVWQKSSFCQNGECAEIAKHDTDVLLRSTRSPGTVVRLTAAEWEALVLGIRAGDFDDLG